MMSMEMFYCAQAANHHFSNKGLYQKTAVVCVNKLLSQHLPGKTVGELVTPCDLNLVSAIHCHLTSSQNFKTCL
jgi:hypothetical protein